eukprot:jgi/Picsp_1/6188/NSC_03542-R1_senescence-associated protein din1
MTTISITGVSRVTQPRSAVPRLNWQQRPQGRHRESVLAKASQIDSQQKDFEYKYPAWDSIHYELVNKHGLKSVSPEEANVMLEAKQAILVDVRPEESHDEYHPEGAINVPAFRIIKMSQGGGFGSVMRFAVMTFNGVTPTEANPEFPDLAKSAAEGDKMVILVCEQGGSLAPTTTFPTGKVSRSLKAAWRLIYNGALPAEKVMHLEGGVRGWRDAGLPISEKE